MIKLDRIIMDEVFYIDDFNLGRISNKPINRFSISTIPLRKISMKIEDRYYSLTETPAYLYLEDSIRWRQEYIDYCKKYGQNNPDRTIENYDRLIKTFSADCYNMKNGAIVVDQNNVLQEGQHRCCILLHQKGKNYKVKVVKLYYKRNIRTILYYYYRRYISAK